MAIIGIILLYPCVEGERVLSPKFHWIKTELALRKGVKLFHIWQDMKNEDVFKLVDARLGLKPLEEIEMMGCWEDEDGFFADADLWSDWHEVVWNRKGFEYIEKISPNYKWYAKGTVKEFGEAYEKLKIVSKGVYEKII